MEEGRAQSRRPAGTLLALALAAAALVATTARAADPALPVDPGPDPSGQGALIDQAASDPGQACQDQVDKNGLGSTTQGTGCDNKYTPIGKDGKGIGWTQFAGAVFQKPDGSLVDHPGYDPQGTLSKVPVTVDFYTVSFANAHNGLAGGSQCKDDPPANATDAEQTDFLNKCERVPVIYRFTDNTQSGAAWEEAYRGDTPGYVGAITWLHNRDTQEHGQRALAVGGDSSPSADCPKSEANPPYPKDGHPGCGGYPRREPAIPDDVAAGCLQKAVNRPAVNPDGKTPEIRSGEGLLSFPQVDSSQTVVVPSDAQEELASCEADWRQAHDPAGKARSWLYSDGDWQELDMPPQMRGTTALDAALDLSNCAGASKECAFAGGLQQIWMWKDGGFDPKPWKPDPTPDSPSQAVGFASDPACRTSWACQWHYRVRAIRFDTAQSGGAWAVTSGCCSTSPNPDLHSGRVLRFVRGDQRWLMNPLKVGTAVCGSFNEPSCGPQMLADSLYALTLVTSSFGGIGSRLASPGGPEQPGEPPSQITPADGLTSEAARPWVSSARLVAGDGDFQQHQQTPLQIAGGNLSQTTQDTSSVDNIMDWAVGGLKGSGRAVAYTTTTQTYGPAYGADGAPFPLDCPQDTVNGAQSNPNGATSCKPNDKNKTAEQTRSGYLFSLSSYFLNGFAMAGNSGIGWGVGDRGAIERLAGNDAAAGGTLRPVSPPKLGARRPGSVPPREAYNSSQEPLSNRLGAVPGLASQELQKLPEPHLTAFGSPNPHADGLGHEGVQQVAMSRDGSEGWAIGPHRVAAGYGATTLYRFDGTRWRRCSTDSVDGV
ncbi:MAG: hypothetical protein QOG09_312, partial [Solirubrobacterales bacterium]|nr:hypothetical protein [Solirubrobacterales bacterium]